MKKIVLISYSVFFILLSNPILAQLEDPGDDPETPAAPIDNYLWVLGAIGLIYVFLKLRSFAQSKNELKD